MSDVVVGAFLASFVWLCIVVWTQIGAHDGGIREAMRGAVQHGCAHFNAETDNIDWNGKP